MAWIKTRVSTEGFAFAQHPIQSRQAARFEADGIKRMGFGGLPERQQLIPKSHNMSIGDVLEA